MIDYTFTYNGCKPVLHMQNTWVKLDEPSMYRHGLGTLETERSNVSHIVDMINMEMFDTSILRHASISIFIALWAVITHYVTILMPIFSYFTRFT